MVRHRKNNRIDNRGSSFVEIIVSVLIVAIVFVPLLNGIAVAVKINRKSENKLCADTAASNILETAKALGLYKSDGLNSVLASPSGATYSGIDNALLSKIAGYDNGGTWVSGNPDPTKSFNSYLTDSFIGKIKYPDSSNAPLLQFYLANVRQGTHEYYAVVSVDDSKYAAQNDSSQYEGIGDITGGSTGQLNVGKSVEITELNRLCQIVNNKNGTSYTPDTIPQFINSKEIRINVKKDLDDNSENVGKYVFECEFVYQLNNCEWSSIKDDGVAVTFPTREGSIFDDSRGSNYTYTSGTKYVSAYSSIPEVMMLYCSTLTDPETLNQTTTYQYSDGRTGKRPTETITLHVEGNSLKNIYIMTSGVDVSAEDSVYLGAHYNLDVKQINPGGTETIYDASKMNIYSKLPLTGTGFTKNDSLVKEAQSGQYSKMYDITVDVYDILGEKVVTKTSAVFE